jgi:hypothetical protein
VALPWPQGQEAISITVQLTQQGDWGTHKQGTFLKLERHCCLAPSHTPTISRAMGGLFCTSTASNHKILPMIGRLTKNALFSTPATTHIKQRCVLPVDDDADMGGLQE